MRRGSRSKRGGGRRVREGVGVELERTTGGEVGEEYECFNE